MSHNKLGALVLNSAESWIGTPYRHQMSSKHVGCDCLGLVLGIWSELGGSPISYDTNYSRDWAECAPKDLLLVAANRYLEPAPKGSPSIGDVLLFKWSSFTVSKHVAIYAGGGQIIHAYERHAVCKAPLVPQWRRRISGIFQFPDTFNPE
ncbi:NlpC/P60 family protein [Ahrensia marina]|uniref:NlpC/P60 family protein n=1 Tax=Ahrensia marina TaxID=1514904 RepID=UPI00191ADC9C|nr:NlpC/P60 family protein [Ahrensia marina]